MDTNLLHGDLCPLCRRPLMLRTTVNVRSNTPCPTRIERVPHCDSCASKQEWADMMRALYES
ncbi:hypothetical protein ACIREE_40850 [Streptomyces sp. NPDC102467]|uniref:hypothetical protein n=1 Tax=Streptomyces sp. NPDC102467 TaxID=3366179 RepID=UPI00382B2474